MHFVVMIIYFAPFSLFFISLNMRLPLFLFLSFVHDANNNNIVFHCTVCVAQKFQIRTGGFRETNKRHQKRFIHKSQCNAK